MPAAPAYLNGLPATFGLAPYVLDDRDSTRLILGADGATDVIADFSDTRLMLTPHPGWRGEAAVSLAATDRCDNVGVTLLQVSEAEVPSASGPGEPG